MKTPPHAVRLAFSSTPQTRGCPDRIAAAALLRDARAAMADGSFDDRIDWAYASVPECLGAIRMKVRSLIDMDDHETVRAVLAQALLIRPMHPSLGLLRGEILLHLDRVDDAAREVRLALDQRPTHGETLHLGARIALRNHDPVGALHLLERAVAQHPLVDEFRSALIPVLLDLDRAQDAARHVDLLLEPNPVLRATVLARSGSMHDALAVLTEAMASDDSDEVCHAFEAQLDLLERIGDLPALATLIDERDANLPTDIELCVARSMLTLGRFGDVLRIVEPLTKDPTHRLDALRLQTVAASAGERHVLAREALMDLYRSSTAAEASTLADLWRRVWLGQAIIDPVGSRQAGADPHVSLLQPMLATAIEVIGDALEHDDQGLSHTERHRLVSERTACLIAAGRQDEVVPPFEDQHVPVIERITPSALPTPMEDRARDAA
ncbi:MAG: tetratricopeptide repeat protein [Planctomycetota bacterium]